MSTPLLAVRDLRKTFPIVRGRALRRSIGEIRAVDGVSLTLGAGETLGLVGESGCGKSTLARCILRLLEPTAGEIEFDGRDVRATDRRELRGVRRDMQIIFQDPYGSLNPRMRVEQLVAEPLRVHGVTASRRETRARVKELLALVGLAPEHADRYPYSFSGGQRQRIGIARALATEPKLLILDEPVSALDVSSRAQILALLEDLQARLGLAYLFVSHDLSVVRYVSARVAVMYLGKIVELAPRDELFGHPRHPYTQALLSAVPVPDPKRERRRRRIRLTGEATADRGPAGACAFVTRCPVGRSACAQSEPALEAANASNHETACFFPQTLNPI
ncbi:MAG TPA: oligopeptide/dipeptide ABC transporter ATP-binding protein [Solirubrobacteraceae bacterium]|nr:oligopeptide/dipeptide ABC transporter ATP-binding protein [Solirubrobacteraceae bacterium]